MIKRKTKAIDGFSMSSMTDIIFLLLIFFMLTSTIVAPNAIKVLLPEGKAQTQAKPLARVTIDKELNFFVQWDKDEPMQIEGLEELTAFLFDCREKDEEMYIALYADVSIPYGEVVKVLNIANDNEFKMVLATRQPDKK
ncbi:MAG: biopolymer transporter ExbD [Bacteroidales bacterium]|jgi:biopolymer transport protein ExbD|nr:biopolymer transporter ExbD [Bacteroidales bacterium]MBO5664992.1 biopolymer transporter ExbD [Bacteroidaceae bacterium]